MTELEIDNAIRAVVQHTWRKVAMIVVTAAANLGPGLPEGDTGYQLIAKRIKALVRDGHLLAQGNLSRWRHSEVRLP
jgi:hypothetical protein